MATAKNPKFKPGKALREAALAASPKRRAKTGGQAVKKPAAARRAKPTAEQREVKARTRRVAAAKKKIAAMKAGHARALAALKAKQAKALAAFATRTLAAAEKTPAGKRRAKKPAGPGRAGMSKAELVEVVARQADLSTASPPPRK